MENTPGMMNTCTFIPGSTTLSIPTHSRKISQNFQQLEKESSNTVALPGFNHNADTTSYVETSRNMHSNGTLSTNLQTDTNRYANMDTNHAAHRYRDTRKEVHLLQNHQNSDHLKQWHTETQGKKPTFFQDHLNSNRLKIQKLRGATQHTSSRQDKNTADSQKSIKLSFRTIYLQ